MKTKSCVTFDGELGPFPLEEEWILRFFQQIFNQLFCFIFEKEV